MLSVATKQEADKVRLPYGDTDRLFKWEEKKKRVYFSACRVGDTLEIHIATITGKRKLSRALNEFCESVFKYYEWCNRIVGLTVIPSLVQLGKKNKFREVGGKYINWKGQNVWLTMLERVKQ